MAHGGHKHGCFGVTQLGAASALLLCTSSASALTPTVITLASGEGGDQTQNGGAGNEQPTVVAVKDDSGQEYVVVITMSSSVEPGQGLEPWQCKCSSVRLSASGPPEIVVDQAYLTRNAGLDRPCNHPFAATDGKRIVWAHGHTAGGHTHTFVQTIDALCKPLSDTFRISDAKANAQQGAPEIRFVSGQSFIAGYYHDGGDGDDHTYVRGLTLGADSSVSAGFRVSAVDDNAIGRPAIATYGDRALVCAAKGHNRPPEVGVACAWINAVSGSVYWRDRVVAPSDPANNVYMNQPSLASLGDGRFALQVIESTGQGKTDNVKGVSRVHLYVLEPRDTDGPDAAGVRATLSNVGVYQTHAAILSGKYGTTGETYVGLFEAPITGSGLPVISFLGYDAEGPALRDLDESRDQWLVGANAGDSGKLSNLYGANPGKQGRDFMRGIGDVPNPGAGLSGGWMPQVKSFFVLPYAGKRQGEDKNALFLSFVPGETSPPPQSSGSGSGGSPPAGPSTSGPSDSGPSGAGPEEGLPAPEGCACGVTAPQGRRDGLAFAGVAVVALARRRRRARRASRAASAAREASLVPGSLVLGALVLGASAAGCNPDCPTRLLNSGETGPCEDRVSYAGDTDSAAERPCGNTGRSVFEEKVHPILDDGVKGDMCAACHSTDYGDGAGAPAFLGSRKGTYDKLVADPRFVPADPGNSLLLTKGAHTGPALSPTQHQIVQDWLTLEAAERSGHCDGAAGTDAPPEGKTCEEALAEIGACMTIEDWTGSGMHMIATQKTLGGQCHTCHQDGTGANYMTDPSSQASILEGFEEMRLPAMIQKLVRCSSSAETGAFEDLVPSNRWRDKGGEGTGHPKFTLLPEHLSALEQWFDATHAKWKQGPCTSP